MPTPKKINSLLEQLTRISKEEQSCRKKILKLQKIAIQTATNNLIKSSTLAKKVNQRKWEDIAQASAQKQQTLLHNMDELVELNISKENLMAKKSILIKPHQDILSKPIIKQVNWQPIKESLIQSLKRNKKKPTEIKNYIDFLETFDYKKRAKVSERIIEKHNEQVEFTFDKLLSGFAKEYFARMAATVNLNELSKKTTTQAKSINKQALKLSDDSFSNLKKIFGSKPVQQKKALKSIYKKIDTMLFKLLPVALSLYKQSISNTHTVASLDDISIDTGVNIRELFLLLLTVKKIEFLVSNPNSKTYKYWETASKKTTLKSKEPKAKLVTIQNLLKEGTKHNNTLITIKGKITRIKINHKFNKVISYAFISNGKQEVRITLPHIKIDSGGMVPGSYAKVVGKWMQENKESYNKPSLSLDRVSYTTLSKNHWKSWIVLQMNKVYQPNPHSLNIYHSWKPGANGAINPLKYSLI